MDVKTDVTPRRVNTALFEAYLGGSETTQALEASLRYGVDPNVAASLFFSVSEYKRLNLNVYDSMRSAMVRLATQGSQLSPQARFFIDNVKNDYKGDFNQVAPMLHGMRPRDFLAIVAGVGSVLAEKDSGKQSIILGFIRHSKKRIPKSDHPSPVSPTAQGKALVNALNSVVP